MQIWVLAGLPSTCQTESMLALKNILYKNSFLRKSLCKASAASAKGLAHLWPTPDGILEK